MELHGTADRVAMSRKGRLSVFDLVIMIAATAPGLALARSLPDYIAINIDVSVNYDIHITNTRSGWSGMGWSMTQGNYTRSAGRPFKSRASYWLGHIPCWASPCLLCWTVAAIALSLRGPRPRFRQLARRRSVAAGLAVVLALTAEAIQALRFVTTSGVMLGSSKDGWATYGVVVLTSFVRLGGFSVAAWWLALALSGRWMPERNAAGRLGRAFGWCWIAMAVSSELGVWCFALNY